MHLLALSLRRPLTLLFIHGLALIAGLGVIYLRLAPALDTNPYGESPYVLISHRLFDNTISNIVGSDNDEVERLNAFRDTFGADEFVQVTVSGKGDLDGDALGRIATVIGDLELGYQGSQVIWIGRSPHAPDDLKLNLPVTDGELAAFLTRLKLDPTARRLLRVDGSTWDLSLLVQMPPGEHNDADRARFIEHIRTLWRGEDLPGGWHVEMIGVPTLLSGLRSALEKTITVNFPLVNVIVIAISWLVARRARLVLLVYLPLLQAEIWLAALYLGSGHAFNYVTGNMSTVVMVIGTAVNIHVLSAYVAQRGKQGPDRSLVRAFGHVGRPIAFATFTTTLALLSFFASHDPAIRDFGLFASLGLLGVLLCTFTLLPALVVRLDKDGDHPAPKPLRVVPWFLGLSIWAWGRPRLVLTLTAGLMLAGLAGIAFLKIGTNVHGYFMPGSELRQALRYTGERFPGYIPFEAVVTLPRTPALDAVGVIDLSRSIKRAIVAHTQAEGDAIEPNDLLGLADLVDAFCLDPKKSALCPEGRIAPRAAEALVDALAVTAGVSYLHRDADLQQLRLTLFFNPVYASGAVSLAADLSRTIEDAAGPESRVTVTGMSTLWAQHDTAMTSSLILSLAVAATLILVLMALAYRDARAFFISIIPNAVPLVLVLGGTGLVCVLLPAQLPSTAFMFTTVAVGVVVDSTLFFLLTYQQGMTDGLGGRRSLQRTLDTVGPGIVVTGLALAVGTATLLSGELVPIKVFGGLLSLTVMLALLADLLVVPALCRLFWSEVH